MYYYNTIVYNGLNSLHWPESHNIILYNTIANQVNSILIRNSLLCDVLLS